MAAILFVLLFVLAFVIGYLLKNKHPKTMLFANNTTKALRLLNAVYLLRIKRPLRQSKGKWFVIYVMGFCYLAFILYVFI